MLRRDIVLISSISYILLIPAVYGYKDPATAMMVFGSIWPIITMIGAIIGAFLVKHFIRPIKKILSKVTSFFK